MVVGRHAHGVGPGVVGVAFVHIITDILMHIIYTAMAATRLAIRPMVVFM